MSDLNYENLLDAVQKGDVEQVETLLQASNEEILKAIGPGKYNDLLDQAIFSKNAPIVKALFKHTNLVTKTPEAVKELFVGKDGKVDFGMIPPTLEKEKQNEIRENLKKIAEYVKQWELATKRSNTQNYIVSDVPGKRVTKARELQQSLDDVTENHFDDLMDRIQRRFEFEKEQHGEREGVDPKGQGLERWYDENSWILNGDGALEYDMYGLPNRDEIIQKLKDQGIEAQPMEDKQKNGTNTNYRVIVKAQDVDKLKKLIHQQQDYSVVPVGPTPIKTKEEPIEPDVLDPEPEESTQIEPVHKPKPEVIDVDPNDVPPKPQDPEHQTPKPLVVFDEKVLAFAKKLHEIAKISGLPSDQEEMPIQGYVRQHEEEYRYFMDAVQNFPVIIDNKTEAVKNLVQDPRLAQVMQGVELLSWYAGGFRHPKKDESVQTLHDLADKGYPQAQVHYVNYMIPHMVTQEMRDRNRDEIRYYYDQLQANGFLPDALKNSREFLRVGKFVDGVMDIDTDPMATRPELIKWEDVAADKVETRVPPSPAPGPAPTPGTTPAPEEEEKPTEETRVDPTPAPTPGPTPTPTPEETRVPPKPPVPPEPEKKPEEEKKPEPKPETKSSYDAFKIPGHWESWDEDEDNKRLTLDTRRMSPEDQKLTRDILKSYNVPFGEDLGGDTKGIIYIRKDGEEFDKLAEYCERVKIQEDAKKEELASQPKPDIVDWISPALAENWCCHKIKSGRLDTNRDVKSFSMYPTTWYFKPKDEKEKEAVLKYLEIHGELDPSTFHEEDAIEDLNTSYNEGFHVFSRFKKSKNPIKKGEKVIAISDPEAVKKLMTLWDHAKKAPEIANPPKGMLSDARTLGHEDGRGSDDTRTPKGPDGHGPGGHGPEGDGPTPGGDGGKPKDGDGKEDKKPHPFLEGFEEYTKALFNQPFDDPEKFGQEVLYQSLALPLNWLAKYLDTLGKKPKVGKPKPEGKETPDEKSKRMAATMEVIKRMAKEDPDLFRDLMEKGLIGATDGKEAFELRKKALKEYFESHPEDLKRLTKAAGKVAKDDPALVKEIFPKDMKAKIKDKPVTADMMVDYMMGWHRDSEETRSADSLEDKLVLLMDKVEKLTAQVADLTEQVKVAKAENERLMAQNLALQEQLLKVKSGELKPEDIKIDLPTEEGKKSGDEKSETEPTTVVTPDPGKTEVTPVEPATDEDAPEETTETPAPTEEKTPVDKGTPVPPTVEGAGKGEGDSKPAADKDKTVPVKGTSETEKAVIRDMNTLDAKMDAGSVVARLDEAKKNKDITDPYILSVMDVVQQWYQTPVEKRKDDLNGLIRTAKDVEAAKAINNVIDDGYDETTGVYKKVIELSDTVDKEKVLANRERLLNLAHTDLAKRRPDLYEQMKLSRDKKGEAVLTVGDLKVKQNLENKGAPDPTDELKFSTKPKSKLDEVFQRYNLSKEDKRDLRIILAYFDEQTKKKQTVKTTTVIAAKGNSK